MTSESIYTSSKEASLTFLESKPELRKLAEMWAAHGIPTMTELLWDVLENIIEANPNDARVVELRLQRDDAAAELKGWINTTLRVAVTEIFDKWDSDGFLSVWAT